MRRIFCAGALLLMVQAVSAQKPVKTVQDGVLDTIELFVDALDHPADLTVVIRPFDTSQTDLGTGGTDGKDTRRDEAKTMQIDGPRVLAERFVATIDKGAFKAVEAIKVDDPVPANAVVIEGRFVKLDPGSRTKRYFAGFGAGKSTRAGRRHGEEFGRGDAGDVRAAALRRDGPRGRRLPRKADDRFAKHR